MDAISVTVPTDIANTTRQRHGGVDARLCRKQKKKQENEYYGWKE
jgi:hypothetical protein